MRRGGAPRAALFASALALAAGGCGGGRETTDGPLSDGSGRGASRVGVPQPAGKAFVFSLPVVVNSGKRPITFERLGIEKPPAGLTVLETHVQGPDREANIAFDFDWPPRSRYLKGLRSVRGFVLRPKSEPAARNGAQLVYVMRARKPGEYAFKKVTVDYRVGDEEHRAVIPMGLLACVFPTGVKPDLDRCAGWAGS